MTPSEQNSSIQNDVEVHPQGKIMPGESIGKEIFYGALTSFLFGLIVSILFSFGASSGLEPVEKLERAGVDFGVRMASAINDMSRDSVPIPTGANPIVSVDIDRDTCIALASESRCDFDRIGQPEVLTAIDNTLRFLEKSSGDASPIAVIDFLMNPDYAPAFDNGESLQFAAMEVRSVEIKASDPTKTTVATHLTFDLEQSRCRAVKCGTLAYLPAVVEVQDGLSRRYPIQYQVELGFSDGGGVPQWTELDSLAFSVALAGRAKLGNSEGALYRPEISSPDISYSLPSFAFASSAKKSELSLKFLNNVQYFSGASILSEDKSQFDLYVPENAILIFGSSAMVGGDLHNTPLGPMSGMDVLANSIRSFQISRPPTTPPGGLERFTVKLRAIIFALGLSVLFDYIIKKLEQRRDIKQIHNKKDYVALWDRYSSLIFLTLTVLFVIEFFLVIASVSSQMADPAGRGGQVDVIWPVVGLLLGTFVSFAGRITSKIDDALRLIGGQLSLHLVKIRKS